MPAPKNLLFAGCGDLAQGCIARLQQHAPGRYALAAIARQPKNLPPEVAFYQGAIADHGALIANGHWDAIVITLTPANSSPEAYRQAYWLNTQYILHALPASAKPLIVFASSTSVYAQADGSWVDETSPATPDNANAQCLRDCETLIQASGLPHRLLRFAGIYGPGRDHLQRQVAAGQGGDNSYTNRIHRDDACGLITFLLERYCQGLDDPELLLACDDQPETSREIRQWLAGQMGLNPADLAPSQAQRSGNKRCSNRRLRDLGFVLRYPNYQLGYSALLKSSG